MQGYYIRGGFESSVSQNLDDFQVDFERWVWWPRWVIVDCFGMDLGNRRKPRDNQALKG